MSRYRNGIVSAFICVYLRFCYLHSSTSSSSFAICSGAGSCPLNSFGRVVTIRYAATPIGLFDSRRAYSTMVLSFDLQSIFASAACSSWRSLYSSPSSRKSKVYSSLTASFAWLRISAGKVCSKLVWLSRVFS